MSLFHGVTSFQPFKNSLKLKKKNKIEVEVEKSPHPLLDELRENAPYSFLEFIKHVKIEGYGNYNKSSGIQTFELNEEQKQLFDVMMAQYDAEHIWEVIEDGKVIKIKGKRKFVRLAVAKARQMGTSTFCIIFYFYLCLVMKLNLGIINHTNDKNKNLHKKLALAFDNLPPEIKGDYVRSGSGEKEIKFSIRKKTDPINSKSTIFFACSEAPGGARGNTLNGMLLTECGFYAQTKNIDLQSIAMEPNTFLMFESTPWGQGNLLYDLYVTCYKHKSIYNMTEMVFQKWWTIPKYRMSPPQDYKPSPKIINYLQKYKFHILESDDITEEQKEMFKIQKTEYLSLSQVYFIEYKLANDPDVCTLELFTKAYPPTLESCFSASVSNCFCDIHLAQRALERGRDTKNIITSSITYPIYIGVDIAYKKDKTVIAVRQGPNIYKIEYVEFKTEEQLKEGIDKDELSNDNAMIIYERRHETIARKIFDIAEEYAKKGDIIARINIDSSSSEMAVIAELRAILENNQDKKSYPRIRNHIVRGISFGGTQDVGGYVNQKMINREYMYFKFAAWLEHFKLQGTYIVHNADLLEEIKATLTYMGNHGEMRIIEKPKIQRTLTGNRSPDALDAVVLTMHGDDFFGVKTQQEGFDPSYMAPKRVY